MYVQEFTFGINATSCPHWLFLSLTKQMNRQLFSDVTLRDIQSDQSLAAQKTPARRAPRFEISCMRTVIRGNRLNYIQTIGTNVQFLKFSGVTR